VSSGRSAQVTGEIFVFKQSTNRLHQFIGLKEINQKRRPLVFQYF
jgi:hypothetical protein